LSPRLASHQRPRFSRITPMVQPQPLSLSSSSWTRLPPTSASQRASRLAIPTASVDKSRLRLHFPLLTPTFPPLSPSGAILNSPAPLLPRPRTRAQPQPPHHRQDVTGLPAPPSSLPDLPLSFLELTRLPICSRTIKIIKLRSNLIRRLLVLDERRLPATPFGHLMR
jgi:hypothetical protein